MGQILFFNDDHNYNLRNKTIIRKWLEEVARSEGNFKIDEINYVFCSSDRQRELNVQFLGHDYDTDIITFDYCKGKSVNGEIYIDIETVRDNSKQYNGLFLREMHRVIVHGLLHLCGQKDKSPVENVEMHRKENRYLKVLDTLLK